MVYDFRLSGGYLVRKITERYYIPPAIVEKKFSILKSAVLAIFLFYNSNSEFGSKAHKA